MMNKNQGYRSPSNRSNELYIEGPSKEYDDIKACLEKRSASGLIRLADKIARQLQEVEKTQMRKFLDEIVKVHPTQIDLDRKDADELIEENVKNALAILRPRFAYTVTKKGNKDLKNFYVKALDKWLANADSFTKLELEFLHLFIESLIAYHRVYAKK